MKEKLIELREESVVNCKKGMIFFKNVTCMI